MGLGQRTREPALHSAGGGGEREGEARAPTTRLPGGQRPQPPSDSQPLSVGGTCNNNNRIPGLKGVKESRFSSCFRQELSETHECRGRNTGMVKGFKLSANTNSTSCILSCPHWRRSREQKLGEPSCIRAGKDPAVLERQRVFLWRCGGSHAEGAPEVGATGTWAQYAKNSSWLQNSTHRKPPHFSAGSIRVQNVLSSIGSEPYRKEVQKENPILLGHSHTPAKSSV